MSANIVNLKPLTEVLASPQRSPHEAVLDRAVWVAAAEQGLGGVNFEGEPRSNTSQRHLQRRFAS
eukprot:1092847-Prymnesium_polylepis.1